MRFKFELAEISKKATLSNIRCRSEFLNQFENNFFSIEQGLSTFSFCVPFELFAYPCVQKITLQHRNSLKICKWHKGIMVMKRLLKINNKFKFLLFHLKILTNMNKFFFVPILSLLLLTFKISTTF